MCITLVHLDINRRVLCLLPIDSYEEEQVSHFLSAPSCDLSMGVVVKSEGRNERLGKAEEQKWRLVPPRLQPHYEPWTDTDT